MASYQNNLFYVKLIKIISVIIIMIIFMFVFRRVYNDWGSIHWDKINIQYIFIVPAILSAIFSNLLICYIWKKILCLFKINIPFLSGCRIQLISQIGKYIPGKIGLLFTKIVECKKVGISEKISIISTSYEIGLGLYFQLCVGLCTLPFFFELLNNTTKIFSLKWMGVLGLLGFLFIHPQFFLWYVNIFLKMVKKDLIKMDIKFLDWLIIILSFLSLVLLNGLLGFFIINMFYAVSFENIFYIIGATSWAFLLGLLNVFAPSGIGVRDGILVGFYSYLMPGPLALAVAITSRIVGTTIEWLLISGAFLIKPERLKI